MDINKTGLGIKRVSLNNRPFQFSLDRKIPKKGYIKGNVVWSGWLINTCKNQLTEKQFYNICQLIIKNKNFRRKIK